MAASRAIQEPPGPQAKPQHREAVGPLHVNPVSGLAVPRSRLVWVDQRGNEQPAASVKGFFFSPRLSPDGRRIAYTTLGMRSANRSRRVPIDLVLRGVLVIPLCGA